ncbi:MAG: hypothetical protein GXC76_13265 [Rhodanobacteraceae bacterium]|nr:hypothetical protein [Rhodanobacteraceae bacterium]
MKPAFILFCAAALASGAPLAGAATLTVTTLNDSGAGSLRAAITQANATTGTDTIQFQNGLQGTIDLSGGALVITESLSIVGPGAGKVTIDANGRSRVFRFDNPQGLDRTWAISGLTVRRGLANNGNDDSGGGLFYEATSVHAQITLNDMVFTQNTAARKGGAISVAGANLTLGNTTLSNNISQGGFQPSGGGLFFSRGLVRIERSRIVDNTADLIGGGINLLSPAVSAVITDSLVQGNSASLSGGGMNAGTMTNLTISRSAFVGNAVTSQTEGGGIYFAGVTDAGSAENVIENSTFSGNRSQHQFGRGSALAVYSGNLTVRNSTFANNVTSPDTSPGAPNAGGALWVSNGTSTRVTVQSTLFNGNTHGNAGMPSDLTRLIGTPESTLNVDHSLFKVTPAIGVITNASANIEADALLQPLTLAHGGLTPVHPIPRNSPAVDKGANPGNLATDQRGAGFVRTWSDPNNRNGVADIGAYEHRGDTIFFGDFEQH